MEKKKTERSVQHDIMKHIGSKYPSVRIFKNDTGMAYRGNKTIANVNGVKKPILLNPTEIHYGLFKGSSDLIGWKITPITEDMIGRNIAVFVALEVKRPDRSHTSDEQHRFIDAIKGSGGIAGIVKSTKDVDELLK